MLDASGAHLNLWKKRLGSVPEWVWERTELETLVLADNDLTEVSDQIGRLTKLRMLDLGHNLLTRVPDTLADLRGSHGFSVSSRQPLEFAAGLPGSAGPVALFEYQ
jgi:Leucine-rich repeat (LRR) protein